jgi:hypothetical protein
MEVTMGDDLRAGGTLRGEPAAEFGITCKVAMVVMIRDNEQRAGVDSDGTKLVNNAGASVKALG